VLRQLVRKLENPENKLNYSEARYRPAPFFLILRSKIPNFLLLRPASLLNGEKAQLRRNLALQNFVRKMSPLYLRSGALNSGTEFSYIHNQPQQGPLLRSRQALASSRSGPRFITFIFLPF